MPNYLLKGKYRIHCNNLTNCHITIKKLRKNVKMPQKSRQDLGHFFMERKDIYDSVFKF